MSYDLDVYTSSSVSGVALLDLVNGVRELMAASGRDDGVVVLRGQRGTYCCSVDGPFAVEAEDVPEEITAVLLGARWLYTVTVEGSAPASIPHAVRLARELAQPMDGAVVDRPRDTVWSRSKGRQVSKPARESRISTIEMEWFCQRQFLVSDPARTLCSAAARLLPEALPRRFGDFEPLQGRFADVGVDGFSAAWHDADMLLFFQGSEPFFHGYMSCSDPSVGRIWTMGLACHAGPFGDARWRDALKALFVMLADELPAF